MLFSLPSRTAISSPTVAAAKAQVDQAEASLRATSGATIPDQVVKAQTDAEAARQQLEAAQRALQSRQTLLQQGALARKLVDDQSVVVAQAQAQFQSAQEHLRTLQSIGKGEQVKGAEAQVETARAQLQSAQAQLAYSEVHSPIAGIVADRPLYAGEVAQPGTPLLTVMDISSVVARANVPQTQASSIKVGQSANVKLTGDSVELPGKVTVVSPATDPSSTTVQVWVQVPNPGERLKPGASARVTIVTAVLRNITLVPASAILPGEEGGTVVDTIGGDSTIHQKKVEVGVREPDKVQIVSGVSPGEQVVTVGGVGVDDNTKVRIVKPGEEAEEPRRAGTAGESEEMSAILTPPPADTSPVEAAESAHWTARHGKPIIFAILTLVAVGIYLALSIPVSVFPETNFPRIVIGVDNGVAPIDQMLVNVTRPIEEAVNSVPGLDRVWSTTSRGTVEIDLFFTWKVDMYRTLELVNAALARVQTALPPTAKITASRMTFAAFPIMGYSLTSDTVPMTHIWETATYDLKPRLNRTNGVSMVVIQGGQVPEFQVQPDPARLVQTQTTVPNILDAIARTNLIDSPGLIEMQHQLVLSLVSGQARTPDEISNIVVKTTPAGAPLRLGDLGPVTPSIMPVYTIVTANGKPALLMNIYRQPDSNTVIVADAVHQEIDNIRKSLPAGVKLENYYDQSEIVSESIKSVRDAILIGLFLASLIMVLFLRDWGTSLVAGLVIPATIAVTFIALRLMGESFNLMTLGGLAAAVGLVIDDAIVVVENIVLHRDLGQSRAEAIRSALREIRTPLVGSTLTPIVVLLPLISMTGVNGVFFRALAVTVGNGATHLACAGAHMDPDPEPLLPTAARPRDQWRPPH